MELKDIQSRDFRLCEITKLKVISGEIEFVTQPISYGIGVEAKTKEGNYVVVSFVRGNSDDTEYEAVGFRPFEFIKNEDDLFAYKRLVYIAKGLVENAVENVKDEWNVDNIEDMPEDWKAPWED